MSLAFDIKIGQKAQFVTYVGNKFIPMFLGVVSKVTDKSFQVTFIGSDLIFPNQINFKKSTADWSRTMLDGSTYHLIISEPYKKL